MRSVDTPLYYLPFIVTVPQNATKCALEREVWVTNRVTNSAHRKARERHQGVRQEGYFAPVSRVASSSGRNATASTAAATSPASRTV